MRKRSREIFFFFMVEKKKESVWKMSIPVKRLLKPSRPRSAALGNTVAMRASLNNSRISFSGRVRLVLGHSVGCGCARAAIIAGSPYREQSCLQISGSGRPPPVVGCGCSADVMFTLARFGKTCYCFPPLAGGDVNDFCAALVPEKPGCPSVPGLVYSRPFPVPSGLPKKSKNVVPYPRSIREFLRMR